MNSTFSRKSFWLGLLLGFSLLVNLGFVAGFIYHRHYMMPPAEHYQKVQQQLQLTLPQKTALLNLQQQIREEMRDNVQSTREHHRELVEELRREPLDLPALEKNLRATTEPQIAMQREVILRLLAFRDTLNPEQKNIFNEKLERPGFLLHLAGFPGPLWRQSHCREGHHFLRKDEGESGAPAPLPPPPSR